MDKNPVILITGARKGIGRFLAEYYTKKNFIVVGCSRKETDFKNKNYHHFCADVCDENDVKEIFKFIKKNFGHLDVLLNNAGIASMNHALLTPLATAEKIMSTNFLGTFLFCREAAKLMQKVHSGRIVNFTTVAVPLNLEGEAVYAASKAAVESFTKVLAGELAEFGITVNAVGPTPIKTDLTKSVPEKKLCTLIGRQAIHRYGRFDDIANVVDFFIKPESEFITGQILYLGGV